MCKFCENTSVFIVDPSYFDDLEDNPNQRPDEKQQITGCYPLIKDGDPGPLFNPPLGTMLRRMGSSDEDGRPLDEILDDADTKQSRPFLKRLLDRLHKCVCRKTATNP